MPPPCPPPSLPQEHPDPLVVEGESESEPPMMPHPLHPGKHRKLGHRTAPDPDTEVDVAVFYTEASRARYGRKSLEAMIIAAVEQGNQARAGGWSTQQGVP